MSWYDDWNPFAKRDEGQYSGVNQGNFSLPGADARGNQLASRANGMAPTSQWSGGQQMLGNYLQGQMQGQNSLAALQARQAADRNISQAQGFAASARPGNAQLAGLQASQMAGQLNAGVAGQANLAGVAERNAAAMAYGNLAQGARQQDIDASLRQQAINQGWSAQELENARLQQAGMMGYEGNRTARAGGQMNAPTWGENFLGAVQGGAQAFAAAGA
jgi:hypothetical protein